MTNPRQPARHRRKTSPATVGLLRRAHYGDRDAFGRRYVEHLDLVTRYVAVRLRGRDRGAVSDVVRDTFADALTEVASASQEVTGWFLQLAARACIRHSWAARRYLRAAHEMHDRRAGAPTAVPVPQTVTTGRPMAFVVSMARLTDNQRTAVQLRYLDGYPRALAAVVTGSSVTAITDLGRRGRRRLNAALAMPATEAAAAAR